MPLNWGALSNSPLALLCKGCSERLRGEMLQRRALRSALSFPFFRERKEVTWGERWPGSQKVMGTYWSLRFVSSETLPASALAWARFPGALRKRRFQRKRWQWRERIRLWSWTNFRLNPSSTWEIEQEDQELWLSLAAQWIEAGIGYMRSWFKTKPNQTKSQPSLKEQNPSPVVYHLCDIIAFRILFLGQQNKNHDSMSKDYIRKSRLVGYGVHMCSFSTQEG